MKTPRFSYTISATPGKRRAAPHGTCRIREKGRWPLPMVDSGALAASQPDSLSDFWPSKIIDQDTNLKLATVAVHIARFSVAVTAAEGRTLKLPIGGFPRARRAWELEWRCWPLARCRPDRLLPGRPRAGKGCAEARGTAARGFLGFPAGRHAVPCFSQNDAAGMLPAGPACVRCRHGVITTPAGTPA